MFAAAKKTGRFGVLGHKCLTAVVDAQTVSKHAHSGTCVMLRVYACI